MLKFGKLVACVILGFYLLGFLNKIYYNLFHPQFAIIVLQYSSFYSSWDPYTSLIISTIVNLFFSIVAIVFIVAIIKSD